MKGTPVWLPFKRRKVLFQSSQDSLTALHGRSLFPTQNGVSALLFTSSFCHKSVYREMSSQNLCPFVSGPFHSATLSQTHPHCSFAGIALLVLHACATVVFTASEPFSFSLYYEWHCCAVNIFPTCLPGTSFNFYRVAPLSRISKPLEIGIFA